MNLLIDKNNKMAARVGPSGTQSNPGQCCIGNRGMVVVMYYILWLQLIEVDVPQAYIHLGWCAASSIQNLQKSASKVDFSN